MVVLWGRCLARRRKEASLKGLGRSVGRILRTEYEYTGRADETRRVSARGWTVAGVVANVVASAVAEAVHQKISVTRVSDRCSLAHSRKRSVRVPKLHVG